MQVYRCRCNNVKSKTKKRKLNKNQNNFYSKVNNKKTFPYTINIFFVRSQKLYNLKLNNYPTNLQT